MPYFGREREKWFAERIVHSRVESAGLFVGDRGTGKSALASELARHNGTAVAVVRQSERMWPYSGLSVVASGLSGLRAEAVDGVLSRGRDWPEQMLAEELSRVLRLVRDEPVVLVIDDLDLMDASSKTVWAYVCGRLRGTGVSVLATVGPMGPQHAFAGLPQTRIDDLSFGEAVDLSQLFLGSETALAVLHIVVSSTNGNPSVISRVRLTPEEAAGDAPLPQPLRLADEEISHHRLAPRRGTPAVSDLMDLLAVGPFFAHDLLRAEAVELGGDVDEMVESGLIATHDGFARISDPARRLSIHAALPADARRRLHAHAAQAHRDSHPAVHRWHASFADGSAADATELLRMAVHLASAGDHTAAVEFAERGMRGADADGERNPLLVSLAEALILHGHAVLGQHYLHRIDGILDSATNARAVRAQVRTTDVADHAIDDALVDEAVHRCAPEDAVRLLAEVARLRIARGEIEHAAVRIAEARSLGVASVEIELLDRIVRESGHAGSGEDSPVTTDLARPEAALSLDESTLAIAVHVLREEYRMALRLCTSLLDRRPRIEPLWRERVLRLVVAAEVRGGDASTTHDAVVAWRREWPPGRTPDAGCVLILASAAALGTGDDVDELVRRGRVLCRREGIAALLPWFDVVDGGRALAEGRYDDAVVSLRSATDTRIGTDPAVLRAHADLVEALWLSGRRTEARSVLDQFERAATKRARRWSILAVARARAVCRSEHLGISAFREAEAVYRPDDAPDEHHRLREARRRTLPHSVPETRAPRVGDIAVPGTGLTEHEREVVALVQQGLRNREIAASLFVSLRTVELRLTNVYRKLGISSRMHLVAPPRSGSAG